MTFRSCLVAAACAAFLAIAIPQISRADELTAGQKSEVERIVRDLRVHQILEGTTALMRGIIAREMMKA